jgi:adenylate kinase
MDRGELVSDEVMIGIVKDRLDRPDAAAGFILDGFPRTVAQAKALDGLMEGRDPLIIVDIEVPESEIVRRLGSRMICVDCGENADGVENASAASPGQVARGGAGAVASGDVAGAVHSQTDPLRCHRCGGQLKQRADDSARVVLERLKVYHRNTEPLVDYYRARPTFRIVDGAQAPERVAADLVAAIEAASNKGAAR